MNGKVDLHLHLDGSMTPTYVIRQAHKQGLELPTWDEKELFGYMHAPKNCRDLNEYLTKFTLPLMVMQTGEAICDAVMDLCKRLKEQGLDYAEIRFAPQLHMEQGLNQEQVVNAAVKGLLHDIDFKAYLILCCMRGKENEKANLETVKVAQKHLGKGVAAIDLAGAEGLYPTENFETVFKIAKNLDIPFTIHAGEADGSESIWKALEFGAKRIGHGIRCLEDEKLVTYLSEHKIPLEICITSNLQTRAVEGIYPLKEMLQKGLHVTLNTDNMAVSATTLEHEFRIAREVLRLTEDEIQRLQQNAYEARFVK